jgi:hypothetical protein
MNNKKLNKSIRELCDEEQYQVRGLETTGKCIPYIGWYWREVDFAQPFYLGYVLMGADAFWGIKCDGFAGFMENNKWGYPERKVTSKQQKEIRKLLEIAVLTPSNNTLQKVFDYIQDCWKQLEDTPND